MRFTAEPAGHGGNTAGLVVVTPGEHSWRSSLASLDGRMLLGKAEATRERPVQPILAMLRGGR